MKNRSETSDKVQNSEQHRLLAQTNSGGDDLTAPVLPTHLEGAKSVSYHQFEPTLDLTENPAQFTSAYPNHTSSSDERVKRFYYREAKRYLKEAIKSEVPRGCNPIDLGSYISNCLILDIPSCGGYFEFIRQFSVSIQQVFQHGKIQQIENEFSINYFDPPIYLPSQNKQEQFHIGIVSDNDTFYTENARISFRNFGSGSVLLNEIAVDAPHRNRGIGKTLVGVAKKAAVLAGCRLLLCPAPVIDNEKGWTNQKIKAEVKRLTRWYARLGFVNTLPVMKEAIRLGGDRSIQVGICGLMIFK